MKRRIWTYLIAVVIGVDILFAIHFDNNISSLKGIQAYSSSSESDVVTMDPHYLSRPPYFPNNTNKLTKIFLESATLTYDYSNVSFEGDGGHYAFRGVPAVVINATIRNDYSVEEIIRFSSEGISNFLVGIDVYLYEKNGDIVWTIHRGNPFRGCYELSLKSRETVSIDILFITDCRNIISFEIYVSWLHNVQI